MKKETLSKSKFRVLKRRLGKPLCVVVGVLETLWLTTQIDAVAGDIGKLSNEEIAAALEWDGDADELIQTLVDCGWLDEDDECRLVVHDWSEHVPTYIANAFKRHGKRFANEGAKQPAKQGAKQGAKQPPKHDAKDPAPNLTKPNLTKPTNLRVAFADFPLPLQTDQFVAAWADWEAHRKEIRKPLKPTQTRKQLLWLAELGSDDAVATIEHTVAMGWQGLRMPEAIEMKHKKASRLPTAEDDANWNPTGGVE